MWDYVHYFIYLKNKDNTKLTSHEYYVFEMFKKGDANFFPVNKALCLTKGQDKIESTLASFEAKIDSLLGRFEQEDKRRVNEDAQRSRADREQQPKDSADS
eukprot:Opistho-2@44280